jgi:hypothetical protein
MAESVNDRAADSADPGLNPTPFESHAGQVSGHGKVDICWNPPASLPLVKRCVPASCCGPSCYSL